MSKTYKIAVLAGDGIGPEVMDEALNVLDMVEKKFDVIFTRTTANVGEPVSTTKARRCRRVRLISAKPLMLFYSVLLAGQNGKLCLLTNSLNVGRCCRFARYSVCMQTCAPPSFSLH